MLTKFFDLLYSPSIQELMENKMNWRLSKNGQFTVRSLFGALRGGVHSDFPWKAVWKTKVPIKEAFFAWMTFFFVCGALGVLNYFCWRI